MKLLNTLLNVSRTSSRWDEELPPCDNAVHHQAHGCWTINFATLEELEEFITTHGEVVIAPPDPKSTVPSLKYMGSIEIYDTYRE